ncbi:MULTISPECIES: hypothetical protein [Nocardia]|uniref:hypothetical protein n=1 Tax=Nocardia TaxID=1817 RepID=UPI002455232D|nr:MULTISPECIES: hypothetical protein [Nocardia]
MPSTPFAVSRPTPDIETNGHAAARNTVEDNQPRDRYSDIPNHHRKTPRPPRMTADSTDPAPRRAITSGWQIPTCQRFVWTTPPDPDTGQGGKGHSCEHRATHKIRVVRYLARQRKNDDVFVCRAHLADELDYHNRARASAWKFDYEDLPAPRVAALTLEPDIRAYAHGKPRLWLTERDATTEPVELELFANSPAIRPPQRTHKPTTRPPTTAPQIFSLLDEHGNPHT